MNSATETSGPFETYLASMKNTYNQLFQMEVNKVAELSQLAPGDEKILIASPEHYSVHEDLDFPNNLRWTYEGVGRCVMNDSPILRFCRYSDDDCISVLSVGVGVGDITLIKDLTIHFSPWPDSFPMNEEVSLPISGRVNYQRQRYLLERIVINSPQEEIN